VIGVVTPQAYESAVIIGLGACVLACVAARRWPGRWTVVVISVVGLALGWDIVSDLVAQLRSPSFSLKTSLPLPLCDIGAVIAAVACLRRTPLLVEITYFWGLAGTLQGVLTPDLSVGFPHLVFFEYVVGHLGIVFAALFLVAGMHLRPRPGAVPRILAITLAYTGLVGVVDAATGANYMFLRRAPGEWTLLRILGPWPWYLVSAAGVALALFLLLDAPFRSGRRSARLRPVIPPTTPAPT
jgi:hypothetical integral membrane protein (TIGR02206 family)